MGEFPHARGRPGGACSLPGNPSCRQTSGHGEGEEYATALPLRGATHANGPGRPVSKDMRLGAHFGGQVGGALANAAGPTMRLTFLAGIDQVPLSSERPTQ